MTLTRNRKMYLLSHVLTQDDKEYIIIQLKTIGYEKARYFNIHLCDTKQGMINRDPIVQMILPYEQRHRYIIDYMGLLVYAIATLKIIPGIFPANKRLTINYDTLDSWAAQLERDYETGIYDSNTICYPEVR